MMTSAGNTIEQRQVPLVPLTDIIGREEETTALVALLTAPAPRLVTLTGPGGVGKSRLAIHAATRELVCALYGEGVAFVALGEITDATHVIPYVARQLVNANPSLPQPVSQDPLDDAVAAIGDRPVLLVLDNMEQVLDASPALLALLGRCSKLKMLVTSRAPLQIRGEQEFPVSPFPVPVAEDSISVDALAENAAIMLFCQRARETQPGFALTDENLIDVMTICRMVDGLPLAIELAAARTKVMPVKAIASRLGQRLPMLTGGSRDLPTRQRTLRDTIAWSYDLLHSPEQAIFRRLSVFAGGFTLTAAETVCAREAADRHQPQTTRVESVLESIAVLTDHSLLTFEQTATTEPRYRMLETIREYARYQLDAAREAAPICLRHAEWALDLARGGYQSIADPDYRDHLDRLSREHDNLLAAFSTFLDQERAEEAAQLAVYLRHYWDARGHIREGQRWLERLIAAPLDLSPETRANTLSLAAVMSRRLGDLDRATHLHHESLEIWRTLDNADGVASSLTNLGIIAQDRGDYPEARRLHTDALETFRSLGDVRGAGAALNNLGIVCRRQGELREATSLYTESLGIWRHMGDRVRTALTLNNLGIVAHATGDHRGAADFYEESLAVWRDLDDAGGRALTLVNLAEVVLDTGDSVQAARLLQESVAIKYAQREPQGVADGIAGLARIAASQGDPELAIRMLSCATAIRASVGLTLAPDAQSEYDALLAQVRRRVSSEQFDESWNAGQEMSMESAVAQARAIDGAAATGRSIIRAAADVPGGLTPRELDVLKLLADGLSDREIGDALFISHRTAMTHVNNILGKLGVPSRTAAATFAVRHNLV